MATKHLHRELDKIKKRILSLGALVEQRVHTATKAIIKGDETLAATIVQTDYEIDEMEVEIEEDCLKILALHQPVAVDLRFVVGVIKINNDLERIGDEAVNIAQRVQTIAKRGTYDFGFDYAPMADKAKEMLQKSLDALVNLDPDLAVEVMTLDDIVDKFKANAYQLAKDAIKAQPAQVGNLINQYLIARHLERIADHATNIAEDVIYLVQGEIVRHGNF